MVFVVRKIASFLVRDHFPLFACERNFTSKGIQEKFNYIFQKKINNFLWNITILGHVGLHGFKENVFLKSDLN